MEVVYFLRHYVAGLKYRGSKVIEQVPDNYPTFEVGNGARTPIEIINHINTVLRFARSVFNPETDFNINQGTWQEEVERFYTEIEMLDQQISGGLPDQERIFEKLLQGPLSDAMTHIGQLALIRRLAGEPVPGENYYESEIIV